MDYQRACGIRRGTGMPGSNRCTRMPQISGRAPVDYPDSPALCSSPLAIVSSPYQCWQNLYTPCEALSAGTLFRELDLPLVGCPVPIARKGGLR